MAIVLFHWAEHIVQAYQAFVLHWSRPMSMGICGDVLPLAHEIRSPPLRLRGSQAQTQRFWFGGTVPTSIGQIWIPRIELHLIYNMLVFIPMVVAMYYHVNPSEQDAARATCTCARHRDLVAHRG